MTDKLTIVADVLENTFEPKLGWERTTIERVAQEVLDLLNSCKHSGPIICTGCNKQVTADHANIICPNPSQNTDESATRFAASIILGMINPTKTSAIKWQDDQGNLHPHGPDEDNADCPTCQRLNKGDEPCPSQQPS